MSIEIRTLKTRDGWEARSRVPLFDNMVLNIRTHKAAKKGWLATYVTACRVEDGFESFVVFQDFSTTAATTTGRATENAIFELHNHALHEIEYIKERALHHYQKEREHESA